MTKTQNATAAKLATLIARAKNNVLIGGSAGLPVQSAKGVIADHMVTIRINIGAETWYIVSGWDGTGNPTGYTGTDQNEALALLNA